MAIYLGFADISLPNDKLIHFGMFFVLSLLFYWIVDTRMTWLVRNVTFIICTLIGGIGSEFLQHLISPFRVFDIYDIISNIAGSLLAIILSDIYVFIYKERKRERQNESNNVLLENIV